MPTWKEAFFKQAQSDFTMMLNLEEQPGSNFCHRLHYLQMASEKLAKSYLCNGLEPPQFVHQALVRFIRYESIHAKLRWLLPRLSAAQYRLAMKELLPIAERIEALAPERDASRPNPEYPWLFPGATPDSVTVPAEYAFGEFDAKKDIRLMRFINYLKKLLNL